MSGMNRMFKTGVCLAVAVAAVFTCAVAADEQVDEGVIAQLKVEGFQHSQVMDTLSWLSDVYGPRLTGSPALRQAGEWAREQMTRWGLSNAALEPYGPIGRGWAVERFDITMTGTQWTRITGYPLAFSPSIAMPLSGTPVLVTVRSKSDFDQYRGKLRGAIVMNGRPSVSDIGFQPEAKRLTEEELSKQAAEAHPAPAGNDEAPQSYLGRGGRLAQDT